MEYGNVWCFSKPRCVADKVALDYSALKLD